MIESRIELSNKVIMALLHDVIQRTMVALDMPESPNRIDEHHPLVYRLEEELARLLRSGRMRVKAL